ncbi:unnamed protein product [Schistosoma rodhaini]|uniref:J domain-containing protein n=1 Tax=Schistosoma mansoni TaxID=6183 RepID=A0A5K4FE93_SCHMA|nr:unnamed protein product [Schistosoma rodhaini]
MDQINENEFKQLCRLLQIQTDVTINDLRKAYYRLAKYYHPDKNPKNELATTHFILVSRAYQTLCNELHHRNIKKRSLEVCKNSKWKEKKSSIVDQFLSDLQRQDVDWPKSNNLYNDDDNTYSPIEKLLNHLLEATILKEPKSKKEQTSEQKHRDNTNQPTYTRSNFRMRQPHQQESETRVSSTNEKSIVSYCNDVNYLNSQNQSNLQHNKFNENCIIQSKDTDLNEWINEAQHLLDNIKASRRLGRLSCTPCLNNRRNSEVECTNLIPIIDNPDMMRCLICYRKFKIDVATKHVETCTRKGNGTNSLGSTTATGYSPISFRAKQYAEDLQKRTSLKPTMTSNNQSKNEIQRRKTETEIRM